MFLQVVFSLHCFYSEYFIKSSPNMYSRIAVIERTRSAWSCIGLSNFNLAIYIVTERETDRHSVTESPHLIRDPSKHYFVTVMKRTEGPGNFKTSVRRGGGGDNMDDTWDKWVTLNFVKLIKHLQQSNQLNLVFQNRFHSEEYKSLRCPSSVSCTEEDKSRILLSEILPKKGPQSFEFFDTTCRLIILWTTPMTIF